MFCIDFAYTEDVYRVDRIQLFFCVRNLLWGEFFYSPACRAWGICSRPGRRDRHMFGTLVMRMRKHEKGGDGRGERQNVFQATIFIK